MIKPVSAVFGAILSLMLFAAAAFAEMPERKPDSRFDGAQETITGQFEAFRAREHAKAFSYASPNLQKMFGNTERFIGMVRGGYGAIYDARGWSFGRFRDENGTFYQEVIVNGPDGRDWVALYTMNKLPDGRWAISGVRLVPGSARNT